MKKLLSLISLIGACSLSGHAQGYEWQWQPTSGPIVSGTVFSADPNFWSDGGTPGAGSVFNTLGLSFDLTANTLSVDTSDTVPAFDGYVLAQSGTGQTWRLGMAPTNEVLPPNPTTSAQTWGYEVNGSYSPNYAGAWVAVVPEPSSFALSALSLPLFWMFFRRR